VHLRLPLRPEQLRDGLSVVFDATGEPVLDEQWRPARKLAIRPKAVGSQGIGRRRALCVTAASPFHSGLNILIDPKRVAGTP